MLTVAPALGRLDLARHYGTADAAGIVATPIPGLKLMRASSDQGILSTVYQPLICIVFQGEKRVSTQARTYAFPSGHALIVSGDIPVTSRIVEATPARLYVSAALTLDLALLQELETARPPVSRLAGAEDSGPIAIGPADPDVLSCFDRLLGLLERTSAIDAVAPGIVRQLHYWLLSGPHGPRLRALGRPDSHARRIARVTALLRARFAENLPGQLLADTAGMSLAAFHRHFRAATGRSPLQFQKHLRLLEARRLMQAEGARVTHAALAVGYESPSHFTRDYARLFAAPPRIDRVSP